MPKYRIGATSRTQAVGRRRGSACRERRIYIPVGSDAAILATTVSPGPTAPPLAYFESNGSAGQRQERELLCVRGVSTGLRSISANSSAGTGAL